jgi:hypothetical protein
MDPKEEARQNILAYLNKNAIRLIVMGRPSILIEVRSIVPGATRLPDYEVSGMIAVWQYQNGLSDVPNAPATRNPSPAPTASDDPKLVKAVKDAISTVVEGVTVKPGVGTINIAVTGLTAELKKGDKSLSVSRSWGGTMSMNARAGNFYFAGELSPEKWSITLSFPDDTYIPNLSKVGEVFSKGEVGMRGILKATQGFDLNELSKVQEAAKPHLTPVKEAVEAVKGIAKSTGKGLSFGFSFGSPDPMPGQTGRTPGIQGQIVLTWQF